MKHNFYMQVTKNCQKNVARFISNCWPTGFKLFINLRMTYRRKFNAFRIQYYTKMIDNVQCATVLYNSTLNNFSI